MQKRPLGPLGLELSLVMSSHVGAGTKLRSSGGTVIVLNHGALSSPGPASFPWYCICYFSADLINTTTKTTRRRRALFEPMVPEVESRMAGLKAELQS